MISFVLIYILLYTIYCLLYILQYTLYTIDYTIHNKHYTLLQYLPLQIAFCHCTALHKKTLSTSNPPLEE